MKANSKPLTQVSLGLISVMGVLAGTTSNPVQASTITSFSGGAGSVPGITYEWLVQMNNQDTAIFSRHVGAYSWNEPANPVGLKGWTHTSNWIMLQLTQPSQLTVKFDRAAGIPNGTGTAGDLLYPAFSLYSGWDNDGIEEHQYNNLGNTAWADGISYLDHQANGGTESSVAKTFILPAGLYSIAIGGEPPTGSAVRREGYTATFTSVAVPEPETNGLLMGLVPLSYACLQAIGRRWGK